MATLLITELRDGKLWAIYREGEYDVDDVVISASGWIPNVFNLLPGMFADRAKQNVECKIVSKKFLEHSNGGRTNTKRYDSVDEYFADPYVKERYFQRLAKDLFDCSNPGEPDTLDLEITFSHLGVEFSLKDHVYEAGEKIVREWYSEYHQKTGEELSKYVTHETANDAFKAQTGTYDIFGERFFPVVKVDTTKLNIDTALDLCEAFKGHSKPIFFGDYAFIGIRAKGHELSEIYSLYGHGCTILKDREWDW